MSELDWFGLQGRVALITGASSGLGRHFAQTLAAAGCTVGLAARREGYLTSLADEIDAAGGRAVVLRTDVTDMASVEKSVAMLTEVAGAPTILVNNAGMAHGASFLNADDAHTRNVFALNQMAAWTVAQTVCKGMIAAEQGGSVINIASITGERPIGGAAAYAVSKAAVIHMTKIMALELARHDIRVNAIAPGAVEGERMERVLTAEAAAHGRSVDEMRAQYVKGVSMRSWVTAQDIADTALFLASPAARRISGQVIPVDGHTETLAP
jgi:NAD(P)-dependent dehydrogenase (short-subunit alcohol dehydrogenase family)